MITLKVHTTAVERLLFARYDAILISVTTAYGVRCGSLHIRIICLPSTRGEDVFVLLIPVPRDHFARMTLVLLDARVVHEPHVLMHIEVEQRT